MPKLGVSALRDAWLAHYKICNVLSLMWSAIGNSELPNINWDTFEAMRCMALFFFLGFYSFVLVETRNNYNACVRDIRLSCDLCAGG